MKLPKPFLFIAEHPNATQECVVLLPTLPDTSFVLLRTQIRPPIFGQVFKRAKVGGAKALAKSAFPLGLFPRECQHLVHKTQITICENIETRLYIAMRIGLVVKRGTLSHL